MAEAHRFGRRGEALAASYLRSRGWEIVARNWRFHHKEIDLVARQGDVVAFVEVKSRAASGLGSPLASITAAKRRELERAAKGWIALRGRDGESYRFDAVVVVRGRGGTRLEHVEAAWSL
jgi:putative endonuclease